MTLLANVLGGLQILTSRREPTDASGWRYVRPQLKCLIVNLDDAMVQWSDNLPRSNIHRINFAPGEQRFSERYSLGILVRLEKNVSMRRLVVVQDGIDSDACEGLTVWEWEMKRMMSLEEGRARPAKTWRKADDRTLAAKYPIRVILCTVENSLLHNRASRPQ